MEKIDEKSEKKKKVKIRKKRKTKIRRRKQIISATIVRTMVKRFFSFSVART